MFCFHKKVELSSGFFVTADITTVPLVCSNWSGWVSQGVRWLFMSRFGFDRVDRPLLQVAASTAVKERWKKFVGVCLSEEVAAVLTLLGLVVENGRCSWGRRLGLPERSGQRTQSGEKIRLVNQNGFRRRWRYHRRGSIENKNDCWGERDTR